MIIPRIPKYGLTLFFYTIICTPVIAQPLGTTLYAGAGAGRSSISGDYQRTIRNIVYQSGIEFETPRWLFDFSGYAANDDRFKGLTLIGAVGNSIIKIGTGFEGIQSSYPTRPGVVAGFFDADTTQDTDVSVTSIPFFLRIHAYQSHKVSITLDGYTSLYSTGSINIPVHTLLPGVSGKLAAESKKTGRSYGGELAITYRVTRQVGIRLTYQRRRGHMDSMKAKIVGDFFGVTQPITTPTLDMSNESILLAIVYHRDAH